MAAARADGVDGVRGRHHADRLLEGGNGVAGVAGKED